MLQMKRKWMVKINIGNIGSLTTVLRYQLFFAQNSVSSRPTNVPSNMEFCQPMMKRVRTNIIWTTFDL